MKQQCGNSSSGQHYFYYDFPPDGAEPWRICRYCGGHDKLTLTGWRPVSEADKSKAAPMRLIALSRIVGLRNADIAEEAGCSVRSVQQNLRRGMAYNQLELSRWANARYCGSPNQPTPIRMGGPHG
ncbi:hypothetical protein F4X90_19390 [Candidatus Poribacteria bacterium]|nr:hypothetical protein [Candidatus Poribacteria bacterium]